jgi:hypothetical protein
VGHPASAASLIQCADFVISLDPRSAKIKRPQIELRSNKTRDRSPKVPLGGFSRIRGNTDAGFIKVSEIGLSYGITSVGGYTIPMHRFDEVLVHTLPELERDSHPKLRLSIPCKSLLTQGRQLGIGLLGKGY